MLESILIGLITSGVYYFADQHKGALSAEQQAWAASRENIRNCIENRLRCVFTSMVKEFPDLKLDPLQIDQLKALLIRSDCELVGELKRAVTDSLFDISSRAADAATPVDMFSVEGFENVLRGLCRSNGMAALNEGALTVAVPRLFTAMMQEIGSIPGIGPIVRDIQKARIQKEIVGKLDRLLRLREINPDTVSAAVLGTRQRLNDDAKRQYSIKLAGRTPRSNDSFRYMAPRMRRVVKENGLVPSDYNDRTEPISATAFHGLVRNRKRVFVQSGAGVGKTTFLYRLQLEMLSQETATAPIPVFQGIPTFFATPGSLRERAKDLLKGAAALAYNPSTADQIAGLLSSEGRLCYLLDALDQCSMDGRCKEHFQMGLTDMFGENRLVVTCRFEHVAADPGEFRDIFSDFEWVILDGFDDDALRRYLGDDVVAWLGIDTSAKQGRFREQNPFEALLKTPFYANVARRLYLSPDRDRRRPKNRGQLLIGFEEELFREARRRNIIIKPLDYDRVRELLYRLSLDTLTAEEIQSFPPSFLDRYRRDHGDACNIIVDANWVYMLFETVDEHRFTFYHQLLQEYFAARRLEQLFTEDPAAFDAALEKLPYREVVLDFLDDLLSHEKVFDHCMDRFKEALARANEAKQGIGDSGHKFTWLLALRDRKAEQPGLKDRLRGEFDREKARSINEAETDGNYVKIPAGPFLMGGYEYADEQPVRVVYAPDFWISKFAETFQDYKAYCRVKDTKPPDDRGWRGEDRPVINVSWEDATDYARWLGKAYCLPSEAQWEKAARGTLGRKYPWGNSAPDTEICNFENNTGRTEKVTAFQPQMYGLHQMAGNVYEWVADDWHGNDDGAPANGSAWVDKPERSVFRVFRGGGWSAPARRCRSAFRYGRQPGSRYDGVGFRLARSL